MLVYGDVTRRENPDEKRARIADALSSLAAMPAGLVRHATLVGALIEAGELAQGLADAAFAERGEDVLTSLPNPMPLVRALARSAWASWRNGFGPVEVPSPASVELHASPAESSTIDVKVPEGFAFYAVYPEAYATAAASSGLPPTTCVLGIRSIGTTLGASVAAALDATNLGTVRPIGHPFQRRVLPSQELSSRIAETSGGRFAVVDEGPGLSGSSFGAVADVLEESGVLRANISFFPSHDNALGPHAAERHRRRWDASPRHVRTFDELILRAPQPVHRFESWLETSVGPLDGPIEDVACGAWRRHRYKREEDWPPVNGGWERRKFLFRSGGRTWLAKFAGLGREGERKFARARALGSAGFTPPVAGLCHGFLIERWVENAATLDRVNERPACLAAHVGRYLAFRARRFDSAPTGASIERLFEMARHNTAEALGTALAGEFDRWTLNDLARIQRSVRRVDTDNRMHAQEWLALGDGTILKCDALDHDAGHDLIGAQDIAWDVAGAAAELDLSHDELEEVMAVLADGTGHEVDRQLLAFYTPCYLAFQLGAASMAVDAAPSAPEAKRLGDAVRRYEMRLQGALTGAGK